VTFAQPVTRNIGPCLVELVFQYEQEGICVPAGYRYDGASIPRFAWSLIGLSPFGPIIGPATIHDWCYCNGGWVDEDTHLPKVIADKVFLALMLRAGIVRHRAWIAYWAVRLFGRYSV